MAYTKLKPLVYKFIFTNQLEEDQLPKYVGDYLEKNEIPEYIYKTKDDIVLFTDKKIILFDKGGITKKMKEVFIIPYKSITTCAVYYGKITSNIKITLINGYPIWLNFTKSIHKTIVKLTYVSIIKKLN